MKISPVVETIGRCVLMLGDVIYLGVILFAEHKFQDNTEVYWTQMAAGFILPIVIVALIMLYIALHILLLILSVLTCNLCCNTSDLYSTCAKPAFKSSLIKIKRCSQFISLTKTISASIYQLNNKHDILTTVQLWFSVAHACYEAWMLFFGEEIKDDYPSTIKDDAQDRAKDLIATEMVCYIYFIYMPIGRRRVGHMFDQSPSQTGRRTRLGLNEKWWFLVYIDNFMTEWMIHTRKHSENQH